MNGWLIRPFKHLLFGMLKGHIWENTSPVSLQYVCQKCIYCGKERIV